MIKECGEGELCFNFIKIHFSVKVSDENCSYTFMSVDFQPSKPKKSYKIHLMCDKIFYRAIRLHQKLSCIAKHNKSLVRHFVI